uniref:extracellular solute-binding protein n=1 Tax=Candidatus Thiosymbion oneisti TaxID=589554 RepID=UPI000AA77702
MKRRLLPLLFALIAGTTTFSGTADVRADELNLYSYRQPFLIQPLMDAFTEETGTKVNLVYAKQGMLERIKAEGPNTPADLVLTVDIGRLNDMVEAGVLAETSSALLNDEAAEETGLSDFPEICPWEPSEILNQE